MALGALSGADKCALVRAFDGTGIDTQRIADILGCSVAYISRLRRIYKDCDPNVLQQWFDSDTPVSAVAMEATFMPGHYMNQEPKP